MLRLLCAFCLCLSACAASVPPSPAPLTPTGSAPSPSATPLRSPTAAPTEAPSATSTPLARIVSEQPTPVPAPGCFSSAWPPTTEKDAITSVTVAPTNRLFVSVYNAAASRTLLYISDDDAATWTNVFTFNDYVSKLASSPGFEKDRTVYAAGAAGVYRSFSGGSNWALMTPPTWVTSTNIVRQLAVSPNFANDHTLLLGSRASPRGVFASTDGGSAWIDWLVDAVDGLLFSPNYALDHAVWVARNDEQNFRRDVLVTSNEGKNWTMVRAGNAQPLALSPSYAQDSTILWADPASGLYVSRNGDKVFPSLQKASVEALSIFRFDPQAGWSVAGEQAVWVVAFSPNFSQDRMLYAIADAALVLSTDGGGAWSPLCKWNFGAAQIEAQRIIRLALTAGDRPVMVAGGAGARLAVSRDGGRSWVPVALK